MSWSSMTCSLPIWQRYFSEPKIGQHKAGQALNIAQHIAVPIVIGTHASCISCANKPEVNVQDSTLLSLHIFLVSKAMGSSRLRRVLKVPETCGMQGTQLKKLLGTANPQPCRGTSLSSFDWQSDSHHSADTEQCGWHTPREYHTDP